MMEPKFIGDPFMTMIMEKMLECGSHHRRSYSDSFLCMVANFNIFNPPSLRSLPSLITLDVVPMVMDSDKFDEEQRSMETPIPRHHRSLSAHSYLFNKPCSELERDFQMLKTKVTYLTERQTMLQRKIAHMDEEIKEITMECEALKEKSLLIDDSIREQLSLLHTVAPGHPLLDLEELLDQLSVQQQAQVGMPPSPSEQPIHGQNHNLQK